MYNLDFIVKYHDIREELLAKINNNSSQEYTVTDIQDICSKLYRDELTSVFFAENITDDKIDQGIKEVSQQMIKNHDFNVIINELRFIFINYMDINFVDCNNNDSKNLDFIIFITLFSDKIFYIMHKCICQQLLLGSIDNVLLIELKKQALESMEI
jgi:hypothetical protein